MEEGGKGVFYPKCRKVTIISATLIFLMLLSAFAGTVIRPVKAQPTLFTFHAALSTEPYFGYQAGYHDVMKAIKNSLAQIGINLELHYYNPGSIWEICWYTYWDRPGAPPTGWDITAGEQWLYPHGFLWLGEFIYAEAIPPFGTNIMPWLNPKADTVYHTAERTLDPYKRKDLLWKYQEMEMYDCPVINMFYAYEHRPYLRYFSGQDYGTCWGDFAHWKLNNTKAERPGILTFGSDETLYGGINPLFMLTYCQEFVNDLVFDTLMTVTRDPYPPVLNDTCWTSEALDAYPYVVRPDLATSLPILSADQRSAIVTLRDDVYWVWYNGTKGPKFTAEDVKFTYDVLLDPATTATGYGTFSPVIESVDIINSTAVRFNLKKPHADLALLLSNPWGGTILPKFVLEDVQHSLLRNHPTNFDPTLLPGTGPFIFEAWVKGDHFTVTKNPWYTRPMTGTIDKVITKMIVDVPARLLAIKNKEIEFGEAIVADISEWEAMRQAPLNETYNVILMPRHTSNPIWLNLNNPHLANRYMRKAISYAIPYPTILNTVLPGWGIVGAPPKAHGVFPWHRFEGVPLYNTELETYEYDLTKAQYYLNLYLNQTSGTPELGPVGDADQSGLVDISDWWIWMKNIGTKVTTPIDIYPEWPFVIDPDFNNDDDIIDDDVAIWSTKYGTTYS